MLGLFGTLAFLLTAFLLLAAVISVVYALVVRRPALVKRVGLVVLIWMGLYGVALVLVSLTAVPRTLEQGQERCFDEMCFSVREVVTSPTLGTALHQVTAQGTFYIVTVQLRNAGRGKAQRPDHPRLRVMDQQGRSYEQILEADDSAGSGVGQPLVASELWSERILPGDTAIRTVAFDLPDDVTQPRLIITEGGWPTFLIIGDENSFLHPQTAIILTPVRTSTTP